MSKLSTTEYVEVLEKLIPAIEGDMNLLSYERSALQTALAALREQAERENPILLTLDELREMDGEPVWIETLEDGDNNPPYWAILDAIGHRSGSCKLISHIEGDSGAYELYGETWLAYRERPKEVQG